MSGADFASHAKTTELTNPRNTALSSSYENIHYVCINSFCRERVRAEKSHLRSFFSCALFLGLAYQRCNGSGAWDERTDYEECTNFLVWNSQSPNFSGAIFSFIVFPERRTQRGRGRPSDAARHLRNHLRALPALGGPPAHRAGNILVLQVREWKLSFFLMRCFRNGKGSSQNISKETLLDYTIIGISHFRRAGWYTRIIIRHGQSNIIIFMDPSHLRQISEVRSTPGPQKLHALPRHPLHHQHRVLRALHLRQRGRQTMVPRDFSG